jgi:hypothetical protein
MHWLTFPVTWNGSDTGAGIAAYDVYVSDNGGSFQPWLAATPLTSASYTGQSGHTYAFYSVATDTVGHREAAPATADSHTTLDVPAWHNALFPCDVDGSTRVDASDVLTVINYINGHPSDPSLPDPPASGPPFYDVDDSGDVIPLDALLVINYINSHLGASAEGEFAPAFPIADAASVQSSRGDIKASATANPVHAERRSARHNAARWIPRETAASPHPSAPRVRIRAARYDPPQVAEETLEAILDAER